jgi:hypothetical protein
MPVGPKCLRAKCPWGEISAGEMSVARMSVGRGIHGAKFHGAKCHGSKYPWGEMSRGNFHGERRLWGSGSLDTCTYQRASTSKNAQRGVVKATARSRRAKSCGHNRATDGRSNTATTEVQTGVAVHTIAREV